MQNRIGKTLEMALAAYAEENANLSAINSELVKALEGARDDLTLLVAETAIGKNKHGRRLGNRIRAALTKARA